MKSGQIEFDQFTGFEDFGRIAGLSQRLRPSWKHLNCKIQECEKNQNSGAVKFGQNEFEQILKIRGFRHTAVMFKGSQPNSKQLFCKFREYENCQDSGAVKFDQNEFERIMEIRVLRRTAVVLGRSQPSWKHLFSEFRECENVKILEMRWPRKVANGFIAENHPGNCSWAGLYWNDHFGSICIADSAI